MHRNHQQCLVAEWLGLSVTVRVRVRARARECIFLLFFISLLEVTNIFVLRVSGNCDVRGVRTTTVSDVTMMYSQERYMENVPCTVHPISLYRGRNRQTGICLLSWYRGKGWKYSRKSLIQTCGVHISETLLFVYKAKCFPFNARQNAYEYHYFGGSDK